MEADYNEVPSIPVVYVSDPIAMLAALGVVDMVVIEGTEDRVKTLSPKSELVCPIHEFRLLLDACRSCRFVCGEAA